MRLSPYAYGRSARGEAVVTGITSDGRCLSIPRHEMVGIELRPRQRHRPARWIPDTIADTWAVAS